MASEQNVKQYIAYWFQLGKKVILRDGEAISTINVVEGDRYSAEFEQCWQTMLKKNQGQAYLEGTSSTIEELLSPKWEILPCARCDLPVPMIDLGFVTDNCPCSDLDNWPNAELPPPRIPVDTQKRLQDIRQRLTNSTQRKNIGQALPQHNEPKNPRDKVPPFNSQRDSSDFSELRSSKNHEPV